MKLKSIHIYWSDYPTPAGYKGTLSFFGQHGETTLNLKPELSDRILAVVGDTLVATAAETARLLSAACIEAKSGAALKALESLDRREDPDVL